MSSNGLRSDSQGDNSTSIPIITPDHVPVTDKSCLRRPRTLQEKVLAYTVCFFFLMMIVFLAALCIISDRWKANLDRLPYAQWNEDVICDTEACRDTAQKLISNLDPTTDPCVDFYQYACGGWIEKNAIPEGKLEFLSHNTRVEELKDIAEDLLDSVDPNTTSRAVVSASKLYRGCMDTETRNRIGVEPLIKLLKDMGGWPMVEGDTWNSRDNSWYKQTAKVNRKLYLDVLMEILFRPIMRDNKRFSMILFPGTFLFEEFYDVSNSTYSNRTEKILESIVESARLLGSKTEVEKLEEEAKKLILFEYSLYLAKTKPDDNDTAEDSETTFGSLDANNESKSIKDTSFSYKTFLNLHLQSDVPVTDDTSVDTPYVNYFRELPNIMDSVDPRDVANYISYWIVHEFAEFTVEDQWSLMTFDGSNWTTPERCREITDHHMPYAIDRIFIDKHFSPISKLHVKKMVDMIQLAYSSTLDQNTWMDKETLFYSLLKLQSMEHVIGYPDWIEDDSLLDSYYEKVLDIPEDDYFGAILRLSNIMGDVKYGLWNRTALWNDSYYTSALTLNAFHLFPANFMILPAGVLGYPFYEYGRIDSINYGAIGSLIGHEISHAFDTQGSVYDHMGNLKNWWTNKTMEKFLNKIKCFVDQYANYVEKENSLWVDGNMTLGENIADNGAVRNAFKAFRLHLALSDEEMTHRKTLPGLPATPEQLFFLGYASIWCANVSDEAAKKKSERDEHSHHKLRVNIPLSNFKEFSRAFKCNPGTPMNPRHKCVLW